jgi:hypothetical protein
MRILLPAVMAIACAAASLEAVVVGFQTGAGASRNGGSAAAPQPQAKPLRRTFRAGDEWRFRVRLVVRREQEAPETVKTGAGASVKVGKHSAEARLGWIATERVTRVGADGGAEIREQLESFEIPQPNRGSDADDAQSARLSAGLRQTLTEWGKSRSFEFRIAADGKSAGLGADAAPQTDEPAPPLLTLWLAHALRPTATLPERPVRAGTSWQEPRQVRIKEWTDVSAGETDEWLDAGSKEPAAVRLHVVQEISGRVAGAAGKPSGRAGEGANDEAKNPPGERTERFFGESSSTIALDDGHLLAASRSARRETVQALSPVAGMAEPARSRATLSVQVEIENCVGKKCEADGNR